MKATIYIFGLVLLASFLLILQDDFNQEWKQIQRQFSLIDENRYYSDDGDEPNYDLGIQQFDLAGLGRVDRCNTCHLGISNTKYEKAEQPYALHSGDLLEIHDKEKFGCTSCHLGQGYAVSYAKAAHEKLPHWNETMLPRPLMQASCGTCHLSEEVPGAGLLTQGRLLIKDRGCTGCHDINNFFEEEPRGPDLAGIGNKVLAGWLYNWLKNPQDYLKNSRMPTYSLSDDEIVSLMEFLLSLDDKDSPPHPITDIPAKAGNEDLGRILVGESRCISCHSISGRGGTLAPELELVGDKVQETWLPNFLRNVHYYQPNKIMLEYNFTDQNAIDVSAFIFEEYSDESYEIPESVDRLFPHTKAQLKDRISNGRKIFTKYGCDGCHTIDGARISPKVGAKLTKIGNRLESSLDFGEVQDVVPTLYNWLFMKIKQPDIFDSSSNMPNFHLTDDEALAITVALLGNREYSYASEYLVMEDERSLYKQPAGEFGELFERFSCISCHSIDKYGGNISTAPLTIEGSKVKLKWLMDYLIRPYAIRPLLTERMPRFRMTKKEAALMADYIKKVYVSNEIPRFLEYDLTAQDAIAGEQIFSELECSACHIINKKGGYVGPQLDDVGRRLEAGWIYTWLFEPLTYKPKTIHPDYGFTEEQARQLTAYLKNKVGSGK